MVHAFGTYFAMAASVFIKAPSNKHAHTNGSYNSSLFSFIGSLFLFMYWPSANGALAKGDY